jgi:uncharacterized phage infection (PIP) family protein YhgE
MILRKSGSRGSTRSPTKLARGIIKPEDGLNQSNAVIDEIAPKIAQIAQDAIVFAEAFGRAHPSPELDAFIAKMRALAQNNSGGQNVRAKNDVAMGFIDQAQGSLNKLVTDRNALIEHENQLVQAGLETYSDAQKKIQGFYNETNGLIQQQIDQVSEARRGVQGRHSGAATILQVARRQSSERATRSQRHGRELCQSEVEGH